MRQLPRSLASRRGAAQFAAAAAAMAVAVLVLGLVAPEPAQASCTPGSIHFSIKDCAQDATGTVINKTFDMLFGGIQTAITQKFLTYLAAVPNFSSTTNLRGLSQVTTAMAFGGLTAVMTLSLLQYALAGMSLSGRGWTDAFDGFVQCFGSALLILAWPVIFNQGVALTNVTTNTLLHAPGAQDALRSFFAQMVVSSMTPGPLMLLNAIVGVVAAFAVVALLMMKVALTGGGAFVYLAFPLAVALKPIDALSWLYDTVQKVIVTILVVPIIWVLLFLSFAALGSGFLHVPTDGNGWLDQFLRPLAGLALLVSAITVPRNMLRAAYQPGGNRRSMVASLVAFTAMREGMHHARGQLGGLAGGLAGGNGAAAGLPLPDPMQTAATRMDRPSTGAAAPPHPNFDPQRPGSPANPWVAGPGGTTPSMPPNGTPTAGAPVPPVGGADGSRPTAGDDPTSRGPGESAAPSRDATSRPGAQPRFDPRMARQAEAAMAERGAAAPPSVRDVSAAQSALNHGDQWRVWGGQQASGGHNRPQLAQMMAETGRDPGSRGALYTIGSATVANRTAGLAQPPTAAPTARPTTGPAGSGSNGSGSNGSGSNGSGSNGSGSGTASPPRRGGSSSSDGHPTPRPAPSSPGAATPPRRDLPDLVLTEVRPGVFE